MRNLAWCFGVVLISGCGGPMQDFGRFQLDKARWQEDKTAVIALASKDIDCPQGQLEAVPLNHEPRKQHFPVTEQANEIEVRGCRKYAVYQRPDEQWVLKGKGDKQD
jgi:hypothetical protein